MGPEGGSGGGTVVAEGTPEEVAAVPGSHTGAFLAPLLGTTREPARRSRTSRPKKPATASTAARARTTAAGKRRGASGAA